MLKCGVKWAMSRNYNCPALERTKQKKRSHSLVMKRGSLSRNDDDGSGNGVAEKMNLHPFKLYRDHLAKFVNYRRFLQDLNSSGLNPASKEKGKFRPRMFMSSIKRRIRTFQV